jgi:hypothetical protein
MSSSSFLHDLQILFQRCEGRSILCRIRKHDEEDQLYHVQTSCSHHPNEHTVIWNYQPVLHRQYQLWTFDSHVHQEMTEDVCLSILYQRIQQRIQEMMDHHPMHYQFHVVFDSMRDTFWLYVYWKFDPIIWNYQQMSWWDCWQTAFASFVQQFYPFQRNVIYTQFQASQYPTFVPDLIQTIHLSTLANQVWQCFCHYHHEWNQLMPECFQKIYHGMVGLFPILTSPSVANRLTQPIRTLSHDIVQIQWRGWVCSPHRPTSLHLPIILWTTQCLRRQLEQLFQEPISSHCCFSSSQSFQITYTRNELQTAVPLMTFFQSFLKQWKQKIYANRVFDTIASPSVSSYRMAIWVSSKKSNLVWTFAWKLKKIIPDLV